MDDVDDLVLDNIVRLSTENTRARLACVSRRHREAVERVNRMYGRAAVLTERTYYQKIDSIRRHPERITSFVCTNVPIFRLPVLSTVNLRSLRITRASINIRDVLAIKHLPLRRLELSCLNRCYYQRDSFQLSILNHIQHVKLWFDDSWNNIDVDDLGAMRSLTVWCRPGMWTRQPHVNVSSLGDLEHLCISCYNPICIEPEINGNLRHVTIQSARTRHVRSLCRLVGPDTRYVNFQVRIAHVNTTADILKRAPKAHVRLQALHFFTVSSESGNSDTG